MNKINKRQLKMLLVTSDRNLSDSVKRLTENFQDKRIELCWKKTERTASQATATLDFDVCLIDDRFQNQTGFKLLHRTILEGCRQPLILLTDRDNEKVRLEALQIGAAYCLEINKLNAPLFEQTVNYAVECVGRLTDLRESVVKHRNLIETLPAMVYAVEPQPPYSPIYISSAFEKFGYPLKVWNENVDLWISLLHPEDRHRILMETAAAMKENRETDFEYRIISKENRVVWVHDRGRFVYDKDGEAVCWQGVLIDVTERKRAETELQKREKLYLTLAQNIPNTGVLLFDKDFRYSIAEVGQLKNFRYTREMLEGKTLAEAFSPETASQWTEYYQRALDGETVNIETERDGRYFQAYAVPVKNEANEIFAGMVLWQDVTESKQAEKSLRDSAAQFKSTFEDAAVGMAVASLDGRWMQVNQQLCDMLGYTKAELTNCYYAELKHPEDSLKDVGLRRRLLRANRKSTAARNATFTKTVTSSGSRSAVRWFATNTTNRRISLPNCRILPSINSPSKPSANPRRDTVIFTKTPMI